MVLKRFYKIMKLLIRQQLKLLLAVVVCAMPMLLAAQTELTQNATSNGAGLLSGGNYTGYVSGGQMATYLFANGNKVATQGIILNEISGNVEFTFDLSGNLTENQQVTAGQLVMKSAVVDLQGTPLAFAWVYLILESDGTVYDSTQTDANGYFLFERVPYRNYFFAVNTPVISADTPPITLSFEENPVFVKEVQINGEVGTGGIEANVVLTPQLTNVSSDPEDLVLWYSDADSDGFGNPNNMIKLNTGTQQPGYVENNLDCDDHDSGINPDVIDIPGSGIDANCDGFFVWYVDADMDSYGSEMLDSSLYDYPIAGQSENNLDCDDENPFINPNALDVPGSGIDSNCDGIIVECSGVSEVMIAAPLDPVQLGQSIYVDASFSGDVPYSASWNWGDETASDGSISEVVISGSHNYDSAGVYVLTLTLTDSCDVLTTYQYKYIVIYDPDGGFVTGSGVIYSPPGASTLYPNADGYASFGFVSKYDKKKGVPKGNTEFEYDAGELDFVSNEYDWLVVSGAKAKFKGRGSINGETGYQFMISAIDGDLKQKGDPDIFRIKIWNEQTQEVVYDNEMGISIDEDPTTQILEGSIVVHIPKSGNKAVVTGTESIMLDDDISVSVYPNPTNGKISLDINANNFENLNVEVLNIAGQRIFQKESGATRLLELNLSGNPAGMYYIKTKINDQVFTNKIILQHK